MKLCSALSDTSIPACSFLQPIRPVGPHRHSLTPQFKDTSSAAVTSRCTPVRRGILQPAAAAAAATLTYESLHSSYLSDSRSADAAAAAAKPVPPLPPPPSSSSSAWGVLPYLWQLAMSEKHISWRIGAAFICMLLSKALGLCAPLCLKAAVDALSAGAAAVGEGVIPAVRWVLCFGVLGVFQHFTKELTIPTFTPVSQAVARRVAYQTFNHVLWLDITWHMNRSTGRLSRILERCTRSIQSLYRNVVLTLVPSVIELVFVVVLLAKRFSPMVVVSLVCTIVLYVGWTIVMTQALTDVRKQVIQLENLTTSKAIDALLNVETVTLFGNRHLEVQQYDTYLRDYQAAGVQMDRLVALLNAGQSFILAAGLTSVTVAAVLWGTEVQAQGGVAATAAAGACASASPGDLVLLQGVLLQLWAPLHSMSWIYGQLRQSFVDMEEFFNILKTPSSLPSGNIRLPDIPPSLEGKLPGATATPPTAAVADAAKLSHEKVIMTHSSNGTSSSSNGTAGGWGSSNGSNDGSSRDLDQQDLVEAALLLEEQQHPQHWQQQQLHQQISGLGLEVLLEDVKFGYQPERQVLRGVSIHIKPGESVAVVGASGGGKSTILKLTTRLYDASSGVVKVNGVDVRDLTTDSLRAAIAVVPQDTVLFNDTILQNIRYGKPTATDDEVIAAAKLAHLHDAVLRMPEGYKTMVGERGLKLSGGEKQRVAIARAFLRAPRLLICDEATSALDTATEASILSSLDELARGRTSIFVAHRLSTVSGCDRILVLAEGKLVEEGSHAQLLEAGGVYADMWRAQAEDRSSSSDEADEAESDSALVEPLPALNGRDMRQRRLSLYRRRGKRGGKSLRCSQRQRCGANEAAVMRN